MKDFVACSKDLLFSRKDKADPRLGDLVQQLSVTELAGRSSFFAIVGYPDDEGIALNGGRVGASAAPTEVRRYFYKMTPGYFIKNLQSICLYDLGDLKLDGSIEERHQQALKCVKQALSYQHRLISIGGGHDYGYPDATAYIEETLQKGQKPLVINFDAHLDVRPLNNGITSGTPFFRLLEQYSGQFDFAEVGIQSQCNSSAHYHWAESKGARLLSFEDLLRSGKPLIVALKDFLHDWVTPNRSAYLSIDIDAFSSAYAMGCSQSWPLGFSPESFFPALDFLCQELDVRSLGIYEVSPPLDLDGCTSKLAAQIMHRYIHSYLLKDQGN